MLEDPGSWLTCRAPSAPTRTTHAWSAALTRAFVVDKADKSAFEADSAATEVDTVAVDSVRIPTDVDVAVSRSVARVSRDVIATTGMRKATVLYEAILLMKEKFVSPNMTLDQIEIDHLTQD